MPDIYDQLLADIEAPKVKETGRGKLAEALKQFIFSFSQGMGAASGAPGRRGTQMGVAAAMQAPMVMQQQNQQQAQVGQAERERRASLMMQIQEARERIKQGAVTNDQNATTQGMNIFKTLDGTQTAPPEAPQTAIPGPGGVTMQIGVPPNPAGQPLPPVVSGQFRGVPRSSQQVAIEEANALREQAKIQAENRPPPVVAQPRAVQPLEVWMQQNPGKPIKEWIELNRPPAATPAPRDLQPFDVWRQQNPGRPVEEWLKANRAPQESGSNAGPSPYSVERATRTIESVNELIGKVSRWNTGAGSLLSSIPESDARNFKAELDTLKANIAFNELTAMREASKTGGALGQVAVRELELLQSALGALDTGQSPANMKTQLQKVRTGVVRWQTAQATQGGPGSNVVIAGPSEALIKANMTANPGMSRQQVIDELSK